MSPTPSVVTITLNPAIDQTLAIPGFAAGRVNRVVASQEDAGGKGVNVACFLADLGVAVLATGFLGAGNAALFEAAFAGMYAVAILAGTLVTIAALYLVKRPLEGAPLVPPVAGPEWVVGTIWY